MKYIQYVNIQVQTQARVPLHVHKHSVFVIFNTYSHIFKRTSETAKSSGCGQWKDHRQV